jgi:hypothetical protein
MPVRWTALIAALAGWSALVFPMLIPLMARGHAAPDHFLALYATLAPLSLFAFVAAVKYLPPVQRAILRDGHSVVEIFPLLNTLLIIAGILLVACICILLTV